MKNFFLIFGYGVPQNIFKDENYNFYLKLVFNKIYNLTLKNSDRPVIIPCGGKTDLLKPYRRTEAKEMVRWFKILIRQRKNLKTITSHWQFTPESHSISTLENLLYSHQIIKRFNLKGPKIFIFCEQTRARRIKILAKKIFKNCRLQILPIDFDVSANRYLPVEYLKEKEKTEIKHSLWALKNHQNLAKHHQMFLEKFQYLRAVPRHRQVKAIRKWWDEKIKNNELF